MQILSPIGQRLRECRRMTPEEAAEAFWLKPLPSEDLVPMATEWVAGGVDDDAVIAAASVDANAHPHDKREAFVAALQSLGVWLTSERVALHRVVTRIAADLVAERISEAAVFRSVCSVVMLDDVMYEELDSPWLDFARLCWLSEVDAEYADLGGDAALRRLALDCCAAIGE